MRLRTFFSLLALAMACGGCRSFLHFSDPSADDFVERLCLGKAEEVRPALEAEAQRTGMALEALLTAFQTACLFRASRGLNDASEAGMVGVKNAEEKAGHSPLTPENAMPTGLVEVPELEERK